MPIDKSEFEAKRDAFLATQSDSYKEEWYATPHDFAESVLDDFHEFLFNDKSKQARRDQYFQAKAVVEALAKEFEDEK